ncbi:unknown protein [Seminavis robusta]|uniref:Uncharacterized protein n=1 Tax=Seminavis robusta TaxID=568900 RepID=A0A9N8EJ90_9STRA|nr:unknown protein [Seminavis robusta]|eukprot:Sro1044_g234950.1 n/a (440) ;mRNA; r:35125-36498
MDNDQVQALVQAAVPPQAVPPPPPPVVPFAVTPAGAGNAAWDFTSSTGLKIFIASTAPFSHPYDGKEAFLKDFLRKIYQRAESYGWSTILIVADASGEQRNITTQHGCLKLTDVQTHAITYLRLTGREHQASACLRKLILGSITPKLADRLTTRSKGYTVDASAAVAPGVNPNAPVMKEDGTCMLFELIRLVSVETRATVTIVTANLNNLEQLMEKAKSNVEDFDIAVRDLIHQLDSKSVAVPPMLHNLFAGYVNCSDTVFVRYIARKQEAYEDGTIGITYDELMKMALEKYKILIDKDLWLKKTDDEHEINALRSELTSLKAFPAAKKPSISEGGDTAAKKAQRQAKCADKFAWKLVEPKQGEPKEKTVNNKEYMYCPYHDTTKWVLKINDKGVDHRTGCTKMKEAMAASAQVKDDAGATALANAMEDVGTATVDMNP